MIKIGSRKLNKKSKGGALFTVPQIWLRNANLNAGDSVEVEIGDGGELILKRDRI